jgi:endonuclease-3
LVGTILSQNTNDVNRDRAFARLRERFPDWSQVRDAPAEEVIETIRSAGLANQKGPRIQEALRRITQERRELSLDFLADLPLEEARTWLLSLDGVGPKTAAIVLLFSLGRPAFPVDTHVHRVSRRLGLIGQRTSAEKAHGILEEWLPQHWYYAFHVNVIRHGRQVCHARKPRCEICVLRDLCDYYRTVDGTMAT